MIINDDVIFIETFHRIIFCVNLKEIIFHVEGECELLNLALALKEIPQLLPNGRHNGLGNILQ